MDSDLYTQIRLTGYTPHGFTNLIDAMCGGDVSKFAKRLNVTRATVHRWKTGINSPSYNTWLYIIDIAFNKQTNQPKRKVKSKQVQPKLTGKSEI